VILFEVADIAKAKKFSESPELKEKMQEAGVLGPPDFIFLNQDFPYQSGIPLLYYQVFRT